MKQKVIKHPKKERANRLRTIISIIGGTIGLAVVFYKFITKQRKQQSIHSDIYIPIGSNDEIAVTKEISDVTDCIEEQMTSFEQHIQDILYNELSNAKKVWVTNSSQEEMQIEKSTFKVDGQIFLGNNAKNISINDICKLKYRNKIYFERDSSN